MSQRRRQAFIGVGISAFIVTLGFIISLNVSDTTKLRAAVSNAISSSEIDAKIESGKILLTYPAATEGLVEISLIAEDGREVTLATQQAVQGINYFERKVELADGVYFAKIRMGDSISIEKINNN
jgi:hypothetical protein